MGISTVTVTGTGNRGVFGGGNGTGGVTNVMDYITISTTGDATDFGDLSVARHVTSSTSNGANGRGVWAGGYDSGYSPSDTIDYVTLSTTGDASDFGNLTVARVGMTGTSNGTNNRGVFGGDHALTDVIDYITISSLGNASDFGDLFEARYYTGAVSNYTNNRGVWGAGLTTVRVDTADYITISSLGDATVFGDLTVAREALAGVSNGTNDRGVFGGGRTQDTPSNIESDVMDYITISSVGDAADFGDLTQARPWLAGASNMTNERGVFAGGFNTAKQSTIDYITINSLGNAQAFGDLTDARYGAAGCSNA